MIGMRVTKIITIVIFVCSCVALGMVKYKQAQQDTDPPVIVSDMETLHIAAKWDEDALRQGLTATDYRDGDLTDEIIVGKVSRFLSKGVCNVEYVVFDHSNNVCFFEREVHFDDYVSPRLKLSQPLMYDLNGNITISDRLTVWDMLDGDISEKLKIVSSNADNMLVGTYELEVEVVNSCGDIVQLNLPLNIVYRDINAPKIELNTYLIYVEVGDIVDPLAYVADVTDKSGRKLDKSLVKITNFMDISTPGCGQYMFEVTDSNGNQGITYLTVVVCE